MTTRLQLRGLSKTFPLKPHPVVAVDGLDLELQSTEILVLLGPSGCGKTTTLRLIAGLETPTAGQVFIDGHDVTGRPPQARHLGMVFQSPALYPQMTVAENLGLGLKLRKAPAGQIRARVEEIAALTRLESLLQRRPAELSGGEQQRVALGRALVAKPSVLLLDEPLASLDPTARLELRGEIRSFQRACGIPMIHVTHDQQEAMALGDRIAILHKGRLQQTGTAADLYFEPAHLFVARFLGQPPINLIPVRIDATGRMSWTAGDASPAETPNALWAVRPEEIVVGEGTTRARILEIVPCWPDRHLQLDVNGVRVCARITATTHFDAGAEVPITFAPRHRRLFDPCTGQRLPNSLA
jgi:ABC-type sugar transport system ATPase subunit